MTATATKGGFAMAIQDEVSAIEPLTANNSENYFVASPYIHQSEVAKLIESAHGHDAVGKFFDDVHREERTHVELKDGVKVWGSSKESLEQIDIRRDTVGEMADAQGLYGNIFQLNYTRDTQDTAKELVEQAGLPDLNTIRTRTPWLHEQAALLTLEPEARAFEAAELEAREAAFNSLPQQPGVDELDEWGEPRRQEISAAETGLLTPDDLDRIPWWNQNQNGVEQDQAVRSDAKVANDQRQQTDEAVEKTTKEGAPLRFETSTRTAEYQPGTNTVDFTNKTTSTKTELIPGEGVSGSPESAEAVRSRTEEVFGAKIDRDEFDNSDQPLEIADRKAERAASMQRATELASHELKTDAQVTFADKNDGIYNGKILGVTDSYLLQRSGPASAVAHDKGMFETFPSYGRDATILYSAGNAKVNLQPIKDKGLEIER
jgi:hypothetical protein